MSEQSLWTFVVGGLSLFVLWTTTAIGYAMWLSGKFGQLMSSAEYDTKHAALDARVKDLELWRASVKSCCQGKTLPR